MCRCGQERVVGVGSPDCTCVQQYFVQRHAKLRSRTYNSSSQCGLYVPFKTRALCCQSCAGDQQDGRQRQQGEAKHEKSACGCCMPQPASQASEVHHGIIRRRHHTWLLCNLARYELDEHTAKHCTARFVGSDLHAREEAIPCGSLEPKCRAHGTQQRQCSLHRALAHVRVGPHGHATHGGRHIVAAVFSGNRTVANRGTQLAHQWELPQPGTKVNKQEQVTWR
jgi:hypothetical protein